MLIVVRATWDDAAKVWEAESLNALDAKLPGLIRDLVEEDDGEGETEVPIEVIASYSSRVRLRIRA